MRRFKVLSVQFAVLVEVSQGREQPRRFDHIAEGQVLFGQQGPNMLKDFFIPGRGFFLSNKAP